MSQPTPNNNIMSQQTPNPYTINPDRNLNNMDIDRNPQSSNMDSNLKNTDMNQSMDVNRGTQAPTNESILERDFMTQSKTGERIQTADTTMSTDMPEATRQPGDLGYNPALFPDGWNSQDTSTWSAEEKLKAKIPGTKEHKIQSNLKKLEKNENLNQGQMDQVLGRDQNIDRDQIDRQHHDSNEHSSMTTGEKIKAAIPGTKEHKIKKAEKEAEKEDEKIEKRQNENLDREIRQEQDNGLKPKDHMTTGEKIKAVIPGTKEHRAKKEMEKEGQPIV